jgi:hypothetical protein
MNARTMPAGALGSGSSGFLRIGAIATFVLVIGWFLMFPVYGSVGIAPPGAEARLLRYGTHAAGWWSILGLMVSTDVLYLSVWLVIYEVLKEIDRPLMLAVFGCHALFVFLDLAVTWANHAALITLGSNYLTAASDAQRQLLVAAASSPAAVMDSVLGRIYAILIPAAGTLLAGIVMLKGRFSKLMGYLALAVGITGVLAVVDP